MLNVRFWESVREPGPGLQSDTIQHIKAQGRGNMVPAMTKNEDMQKNISCPKGWISQDPAPGQASGYLNI